MIKPEWINEFFTDNEDFYTIRDDKGSVTYLDGHLSPAALAVFLNKKLHERMPYCQDCIKRKWTAKREEEKNGS